MIARTTVKPRIAVHKKMIGHTLMRESVPCTLFMYRGNYSDRQFAAALPLLAQGVACQLHGAGDGCMAWAGMTHELMALQLPLGIGSVAGTARTQLS